jgi:hypothetical protein
MVRQAPNSVGLAHHPKIVQDGEDLLGDLQNEVQAGPEHILYYHATFI